jgi:hypothetical protein
MPVSQCSVSERGTSIMSDSRVRQLRRIRRTILLAGTRHDYQHAGYPGSDAFHCSLGAWGGQERLAHHTSQEDA